MADTPTHEALRQCRDALSAIQRRVNECSLHPISCAEAFDSFYLGELSAALTAADAALSVPAGVEPAGWKLVPLEPTDDMLRVFTGFNFCAEFNPKAKAHREGVYRCILQAAPQPTPAALSVPAVPVAVPEPAPNLSGDAAMAHNQCRAVVHMALALAEVHVARALILEHQNGLTGLPDIIGQNTAGIMEWLGDALNSMDAATGDDEWMDEVFEAAQTRWPTAADRALNAAPSVGAGGLPLQAAFETWAADQGCHLARTVQGDDYQDLRTQIAWDSWQACAALASRPAVDADKRDAERYRFLRDDFSPMGLNIDGNHAWAYRRNATLKGPTLDAAIDAARHPAQREGE